MLRNPSAVLIVGEIQMATSIAAWTMIENRNAKLMRSFIFDGDCCFITISRRDKRQLDASNIQSVRQAYIIIVDSDVPDYSEAEQKQSKKMKPQMNTDDFLDLCSSVFICGFIHHETTTSGSGTVIRF